MSEILYALDENDNIVKIDDVPNGKNCGCRCPLCGEPLVAKNGGKIKMHHFAHEAECKYKEHLPQSQIHIMAKQIIEREKKICVPQEFGFREISITDVKLEKMIGEIIPDIIATASGNPFIIEIYVTHKVDDAKKEKIRTLNIPAIEIDLHDLPYTLTEDSLKTELYNPHRVEWIFYPAIKSADNIITQQKEFIKNHGMKVDLLDEFLKCVFFLQK